MKQYYISKFRTYFNILVPIAVVLGTLGALRALGEIPFFEYSEKDIHIVVTATLLTLFRLVVSYVIAVIVGIPLALWAEKNNTTKRFLLPLYDVAQSIPVLIFFPFIAFIFIKIAFPEGAALFILFIAMLWKIVFSSISGINSLPIEVKHMAKIYNISGINYVKKILFPAIVPQFITGSILAFAQGWNFIIVAEALHTFALQGAATNDLYGVGALLVQSVSQQQTTMFIYSLIAIVAVVVALNVTVWQKLLSYAQQFTF